MQVWRSNLDVTSHVTLKCSQVKKIVCYWPTLSKDIIQYYQTCQACQEFKSYKTIRPKVSKPPVPDQRLSSIQIDVVGPLPASRTMKYPLTIIDRTSRWVEAIPMSEATADSCSTAFTEDWVQRFGLPQEMRSDNGDTFVSKLRMKLQQVLGIEVSYTPPYHAASLGQIERMHRDIKAGLKTALYNMGCDHGAKWMDCLP